MTEIFVFGSNLAGRHGKGAALEAVKKHGAKYGVGIGPKGNSYAIPTKDGNLKTLHLGEIRAYVEEFLAWANGHLGQTFNVTRVGCGLAGYKDEDIAPMFMGAPANCKFDPNWEKIIRLESPRAGIFIDRTHPPPLHPPWRPFRLDETPNDYWDHLVQEKAHLPYDLRGVAWTRLKKGFSRYMPAYLAVPFVQFPDLIEMRVEIDTRGLDPEEYARFTWRVPDRMNGARISVSRGDWVPDVNDWQLLARFFHKNYVEGIKHEADEFFLFRGERVFDPHLVADDDLSTLDGKTNYLHHDSVHRRQRIYDFPGQQVRPPDEGV